MSKYKTISEFALLLNGYAFKSKQYADEGTRIIRIANVQEGYITDENPCFYPMASMQGLEKYTLCENDLLISLTGNVGRVGILPKSMLPAALNQRVSCIRLKNLEVDTKYLFYYLSRKEFVKDCVNASRGVAQLNLSTKWLEQYPVPVLNIKEQHRIVTRIEELFSELDKGVETLQTIKQQLAVYRQAVLKEAFEGKWTYSQRSSLPQNLHFKKLQNDENSKLSPIPPEWKYVYLSELGDLSRGKSKHRPRNDEKLFKNGKYPFFQTGDVKSANKILIDCEKKYGEFGLAQSKLWPAGTLCITIAANIAETCFLGVDGCFPDSIVGFTPFDNIVDKEYIRYFIESSKKRLWAFAPATAQKNINLTTLENLIIPYCNIDEQKYVVQEIESRLSVCDSIEQTVDTALSQAEAMRQSILKKAFEGGFSE